MEQILSTTGALIFKAEVPTMKGLVELAVRSEISLKQTNLSGANLWKADLSRADLSRADLSEADLSGAKTTIVGKTIAVKQFWFFRNLYDFDVWAVIDKNDVEYVKMGCFYRTRKEWEKDFWNNPNYPNNDSLQSNQRLFAFKTACQWIDLIKKY